MTNLSENLNIENYIRQTMRYIQAGTVEKERISSDLRAHLQAALESGEPVQAAIERMGSPAELAVAFMSDLPFLYASFWSRSLASIIDMIVIFSAGALLASLGVVFANMVPDRPSDPILWQDLYSVVLIFLSAGAAFGVLSLIVGYFPLMEGRFGTTFGKHLLGLRVLKETGLPIGYKEAILRRLSYYFEFWPVDALFVLFTNKKQRAMDIVARTIVVHERR
jgi:uncharacterized RDD family membrane protein YckC